MQKKHETRKIDALFTLEAFHDPHASNGQVWNTHDFSKEIHSTSLIQQEDKVVKSRGIEQADG
eukprot:10498941-Ditylum_brightwellii.AAC.1